MTVLTLIAAFMLLATAYGFSSDPVYGIPHVRKGDEVFKNKNLVFGLPRCSVDDLHTFITLRELQDILERFSDQEKLSPYVLLKKLLDRIKNKKDTGNEIFNTVETSEFRPYFRPKLELSPPLRSFSKVPMIAPYEFSPRNLEDEEPIFVMPNTIESDSKEDAPLMTEFFPLSASFSQPFVPPESATVHVNSLPDIPVTVSPFMSVAEALRQADTEYRVTLGIKVNFGFGRSFIRGTECVTIKSVNDVYKDQNSTWKLTVSNRNGQVIYHDACLPDEKEVRVRPGTNITVST